MSNSATAVTSIVGIGASAGGLAPIEEFFDNMPDDTGMAFVVVQHLSPDFKSLMDELLARHTSMKIQKVVDGMCVEANMVYLIPPKVGMELKDGKLRLTAQKETRGPHLPIDLFFKSLATDAGKRSIAIVFSGTGSDGSRGICDVRKQGGIVFAQSEETAGFDGMPRAAIQAGVVDAILAPHEMPARILNYQQNRDRSQLKSEKIESSEDTAMAHVIRLFRNNFGIDFALYKTATISRRLERRMQLCGFEQLSDYISRLESDPTEMEHLFRDLLVEVTQFFRDPEAFERLKTELIPNMVRDSDPNDELRVWVPGCATGEEAYSLAMLFHDAMEQAKRTQEFKIFATDVHRNSLEIASTAVYPITALDSVPKEFAARYFTASNHLCHLKREIRQKVIFAANDLTTDPPFTRIDLISCRNVLIYLEPKVQKRILSLFHFGLKTGGTLLLGPSETVGDLATEFETIDRHWRIYRKKRDVRLPEAARIPAAPVLNAVVHDRRIGVVSGVASKKQAFVTTAMEDLLTKYVPPSLLINEVNELVHTFGDARKILVQPEGSPTLDALKMMPSELRTAVSSALHRAKHDGDQIVFKNVRIAYEGEEQVYTVRVEPYKKTRQSLYLVCLEKIETDESTSQQVIEDYKSSEFSDQRALELERELNYTRETLQATVEELESSNEELQATNEELTASNEELQSTNEELHSVNEELYTVNSEHKQKIDELTELTQDMDNLLKSTDIGTIFLDKEFRIRMFTPAISAAFHVLDQDIGRPIDHIAYKLDSPNLLADAAGVLASREPKEIEVESRDGCVYLQRIQPYRTADDKVEGIVLTTTDVTALKQAEQAQRTMMTLAQINEELPDFAYAVSHDLQAPLRHITQYIEILNESIAGDNLERVPKASKVIEDNATHLRGMIEGLLAYSRINTRGRPLDRVELSDVLDDVLNDLSSSIEYHHAKIQFSELPIVSGDRDQLESVFYNIIDNAIQYRSNDAPRIAIHHEIEDGYVKINVTDNGIGMDERNWERIFTIFKRLGYKSDVPGAGVGLALAKRIIVRHGGRIWVKSSSEHGSTISFTLRDQEAIGKEFVQGVATEWKPAGDHDE